MEDTVSYHAQVWIIILQKRDNYRIWSHLQHTWHAFKPGNYGRLLSVGSFFVENSPSNERNESTFGPILFRIGEIRKRRNIVALAVTDGIRSALLRLPLQFEKCIFVPISYLVYLENTKERLFGNRVSHTKNWGSIRTFKRLLLSFLSWKSIVTHIFQEQLTVLLESFNLKISVWRFAFGSWNANVSASIVRRESCLDRQSWGQKGKRSHCD